MSPHKYTERIRSPILLYQVPTYKPGDKEGTVGVSSSSFKSGVEFPSGMSSLDVRSLEERSGSAFEEVP